MKATLAVLVAVVIALGVLLVRQSAAIATYETRLAAVSAEVASKKSASLDLQAQCSEQARKAFNLSGFKESEGTVFRNHYNARLNHCFIETQHPLVQRGVVWTFRDVYDAFEGHPVATYIWHTEEGKKYWEVKPKMCEVQFPAGEKQPCQSEEEFSKLIAVYMTD